MAPAGEKSGSLADLAGRIGHDFKSPGLLERAVTHASFTTAQRGKAARQDIRDNERLEFLGDRVLALVIAEELCRRFPDSAEGELAPRFNALVRRETCADVGRELGLGRYLRLGGGEVTGGGRDKTAILGDACEAVIAALYLDGGLEAARNFIKLMWAPHFESVAGRGKDAKSTLQEWAQGRGLPVPIYRETDRAGPDHAPVFRVEVVISGFAGQEGEGASKRAAEQAAAHAFMKREDLI